ncbi:general secretion pathway protein N [Oxalobacteraceae bacterium GrIS 2.11]
MINAATVSFKQKIAWLGLGLICVLLTIVAFAPASWLDIVLEKQTDGRFALGDVQGSIWNGSAFVGVAANKTGDLTPLLPGRFAWHLSPILLLGQIELEVRNEASLQGPVNITGNLRQVQISPGGLILPSERLSGLGAPLNTVKPTGTITLSWDQLEMTLLEKQLEINGAMKLNMQEIASALSPIKPLGSYVMNFVWHGQAADIELKTVQGPLMLSGKGGLTQGRLQFSGQAEAQDGQEDQLANLLNLLGQRQPGAVKNVIALEFK